MCLTSCSPLTFHFLQERQRRKKKRKKKNERAGGGGGGGGGEGEPDGGWRERGRREERKNGGPASSSSFSLHISSLSFPFSPSGSRRGNLRASPLPRRAFSRFTSVATGAAVFWGFFVSSREVSEDESKRVKVAFPTRTGVAFVATLNEKDVGRCFGGLSSQEGEKRNISQEEETSLGRSRKYSLCNFFSLWACVEGVKGLPLLKWEVLGQS